MSRSLLLSIIIFSIVVSLHVYGSIELTGPLLGNPPSVFNFASGGVSEYFNSRRVRAGLNIIYDFKELDKFYPPNHVLFIIGPDKEVENTDVLDKWVRSGGRLVIMDETTNSLPLLKSFNVSLKDFVPEIRNATCRVDESEYIVLFNVYRTINITSGEYQPICMINNSLVAARISWGRGEVIVVGDSSIAINELYFKLKNPKNNTGFMDSLVSNRRIIVYEGARIYKYAGSIQAIKFVSGTITGISNGFNELFKGQLIDVAAKLILLTILITLLLVSKFGVPRPPHVYLSEEKGEEETVWKMLREAERKWK